MQAFVIQLSADEVKILRVTLTLLLCMYALLVNVHTYIHEKSAHSSSQYSTWNGAASHVFLARFTCQNLLSYAIQSWAIVSC